MTIVTHRYRYKRPPRKRKAVALTVPAIITIRKPSKFPTPAPVQEAQPAPASEVCKSAIVTIRRKPVRFGDAPDMTPEEHQRRGDAADTLWRELVRRVRSS